MVKRRMDLGGLAGLTDSKKIDIPGTMYLNNGRWWWRGVFPGDTERRAVPLKPIGAAYATRDRDVAKAVLRDLWRRALTKLKPAKTHRGTIGELVRDYLAWCDTYYRKDGARSTMYGINECALRFLDDLAGEDVDEFGPVKFKEVREKMISATVESNHGKASRPRLSRKTINHYASAVKALFRWGVENERVPAAVYMALLAVPGLKKGRSAARETGKVKSASLEAVKGVLPFCSNVVADMIRVQLLTGMRSTELCLMRPEDMDLSKEIWLYKAKSKSEHLGYSRTVAIGPKAQAILMPYLVKYCPAIRVDSRQHTVDSRKKKITEYLFDPREAVAEHLGRVPAGIVGKRYDKDSYRKAIDHAFRAAKKAGVNLERFNPHRLRHSAATAVRREFGLDASKAVLGHQHIETTEIYAELETAKAVEVSRKIG